MLEYFIHGAYLFNRTCFHKGDPVRHLCHLFKIMR